MSIHNTQTVPNTTNQFTDQNNNELQSSILNPSYCAIRLSCNSSPAVGAGLAAASAVLFRAFHVHCPHVISLRFRFRVFFTDWAESGRGTATGIISSCIVPGNILGVATGGTLPVATCCRSRICPRERESVCNKGRFFAARCCCSWRGFTPLDIKDV